MFLHSCLAKRRIRPSVWKAQSLTALDAAFHICALGLRMCLYCISLSKTEGAKESALVRITGGKAKIMFFSHLLKKQCFGIIQQSLACFPLIMVSVSHC